jgi:Protein of unknown function (DUF736)
MTTIGTFTPAKDGFLQGKIKTLTLNLAKVTLEPVTSDHESAPAFRLIANGIELGAAWAKTAKGSRQLRRHRRGRALSGHEHGPVPENPGGECHRQLRGLA